MTNIDPKAAIDAVKNLVPLDNAGHVTGCGYTDDDPDCDCFTLPSRYAEAVKVTRAGGLRDAAAAIEALRTENPMNGDGSNYMLDRALKALDRLAGDSGPSVAAALVRKQRQQEIEAQYERLEAENRRRAAALDGTP